VTLSFEVEILAIRAATADELAHGHPHGPEATTTIERAACKASASRSLVNVGLRRENQASDPLHERNPLCHLVHTPVRKRL